MNTLPVEVSEVAFEGNFVNVHARGEVGGAYMAQVRNEPTAALPAVGQQLHLGFARDARRRARRRGQPPGTEEAALGTMIRRYGAAAHRRHVRR